jgi:uncharacterized protein (DUF2147 family)
MLNQESPNTMFSKGIIALCLFLAGLTLPSFAESTDGDAILGVWLSGSGKARIKIFKDNAGKYHGKIVWLRDPKDENGNPKVDKNNPDESKKKTPLLGLQNLRNFTYDGNKKWVDGQIYDPENGSDYSCKMELTDENTLEVRGFIGVSLFGRTDVWKRQVAKK